MGARAQGVGEDVGVAARRFFPPRPLVHRGKLFGEPVVQIPVGALIQEHGLGWVREAAHEPILKPASHDLLMLHNYSNVA